MVRVSFKCKNSNHVILLTALYDILTAETYMHNSMAMIDLTSWLLDEIGTRLSEIDRFNMGKEEHRLSGRALEVARLFTRDEPPKE